MKQPPVNIKNKRATFDYELIDTYTAGIVLTGTETVSYTHLTLPTKRIV